MTVPISLVASNPPAGQRISWQFARLGGISLLALTLAGCASFTKDGGMSPVGAQVSSALAPTQ